MASKTFHDANSNTYDRMTSNSTLTIAKKVVSELDPPITSASYVLDNACGTGVVTTCIKELCSSAHIKAADLAPGMLDVVRTKISEHKWENVETEVLDVRHLTTVKDNTFTHAITNFGFVANGDDPAAPLKIAKEVWRVLKPGGVCVITTWYDRSFIDAFKATAKRVRPAEEFSKILELSPEWTRGSWLVRQLEDAGFGSRVSVKSTKTRAEASSLEELVGNMLLFKDMVFKGYSGEEAERLPTVLGEEIKKLETFEEDEDGGAGITMVAWVAVAWK